MYAIDGNQTWNDEEYAQKCLGANQTVPLRAAGDAIGVAFVFPKTENSKSTYRYLVNGSV